MSDPKRRLGRGLDALLGAPAAGRGLVDVPVADIRPNPRQPRTVFDPEALAELEISIRELGVLVPILVRPLATGAQPAVYELIAGERRWRAAAVAGLGTIPSIVREADDRASLEVAIVENLQREDLDALEEAAGFQHLLTEYAFTQEALAARLGKSRPAIANALRLLGLADSLKARLRSGALTVGHARALLALEPARREAVAGRIEREGLTVRDVERLATPRRAAPVRPRRRTADHEALEGRLRIALAAPVALTRGKRGGKIEIRYADDEDLDRLAERLLDDDADR